MLNALSQSPITAQQFNDWNDKLQKDEIMVREKLILIPTIWRENSTQSVKNKK